MHTHVARLKIITIYTIRVKLIEFFRKHKLYGFDNVLTLLIFNFQTYIR